jgi:tRNA threonylcarbamoyladenosine biosynthesis protein TsaB
MGWGYYRVILMVTLALDTSTRTGSCAVLRGADVLAEQSGDGGRSHAERLPRDLMDVLGRAGVPLADVDVFAVAIGPGSFTGLRVGIATMQGLALAASRPLVGVSALDALAETVRALHPPSIATWIDAWRGEVYAALYDATGDEVEVVAVDSPVAILDRLGERSPLFVGDGVAAHQGAITRRLGSDARFAPVLDPPLAGVIGRLALAAIARGHRPAPHDIRPLYVRRPYADAVRNAGVER